MAGIKRVWPGAGNEFPGINFACTKIWVPSVKPSDFFFTHSCHRGQPKVVINGSNNNNNDYLYLDGISLCSLFLWVSYSLLCSKKPSRLMTFGSEHVSERSSCFPLLQQYYVNNFISR